MQFADKPSHIKITFTMLFVENFISNKLYLYTNVLPNAAFWSELPKIIKHINSNKS